MSKKYSTDELVEGIQALADTAIRNAIIARLRVVDRLCEAAWAIIEFAEEL